MYIYLFANYFFLGTLGYFMKLYEYEIICQKKSKYKKTPKNAKLSSFKLLFNKFVYYFNW